MVISLRPSCQTRLNLTPIYQYTCVVGKSLWELFLEQFDDLLVKILLLAAIISFVSSTYRSLYYY